ncbi:MAG: hypothetical protein NVSMB63_02090 [Sediminibacterium sp.]
MKKILLGMFLLLAIACQKRPKHDDVGNHLKKAMTSFLYESVNNDSAKVRYEVKEVVFFEDTDAYDCEFKVRMIQGTHDTTGVMTAKITKDFSKVVRKL